MAPEMAGLRAANERPAKEEILRRFLAMKCAFLLRAAMWRMVSESTSTLDFDYVAYSAAFLVRFKAEYDRL